MYLRRPFIGLLLGLLIVFLISCYQLSEANTNASPQNEVTDWIRQLKNNPEDYDTWKDLGNYLYEAGELEKSAKCYLKVLKAEPTDGEALYYVGLILESENKSETAFRLYSKYTTLPPLAPYKKELEGKYQILRRNAIHNEIRNYMNQEQLLQTVNPSPQTVAVMPLKYIGDDARFAPLGKGLSEMLMTDLSQVPGLKPVERIRVQTLMDEINLGQTGLIDESSAAKFGKMVGAGKMIHGDFNVTGSTLNIDATYADVIKNHFSDPITLKDGIRQMFLAEKDLAFKIIAEMGVELTPEQRTAIQHVPTQNLQAFMVYCMGLDMEDQGQFDRAASYFEQAVTFDPAFDMANMKIEESQALVAASQTPAARRLVNLGARTAGSPARRQETVVRQGEAPIQKNTAAQQFSQQDMLANRLQTVNQNMGSVLIPGTDSRKPTEEAAIADSEPILEDLPLPPDMPDINQLR